jgi:hypothetical protein
MLETLTRYLAQVNVQEPLTYRNLTVFPLTAPALGRAAYVTLDEALAAGVVSITEVSGAGTVPVIRFANKGARPVLILDGEELVGAKQNRVVNLTILAPAGRTLDIPVSCVEAGRWAYRSPEFSSARRAVYASLRARKVERVSENLAAFGSRSADQSEIWGDIALKARRMRAESPTAAMAAMYERHATGLEGYVEKLRARPGQCGVVFAIQGRVIGFDLFDDPATLEKLCPKLVGSYALDALDSEGGEFTAPGVDEAQRLLSEIADGAEMQAFPAIGEGTDVRIRGAQITGSALIADGLPIHTCAFYRERPAEARGGDHRGAWSDLSRASLRRRRREFGE